jgi:hypothetical protein
MADKKMRNVEDEGEENTNEWDVREWMEKKKENKCWGVRNGEDGCGSTLAWFIATYFPVRGLVLREEGSVYSGERLMTLVKPVVILRAMRFWELTRSGPVASAE